jgi:capsid protein
MLTPSMAEGYADDFKMGWELALQQKDAKFKDKVVWAKPVKGEGAQIVDHIMPFEAEVGGDDLSDTKWITAEMMPRWAFPTVIRVSLPITTTDKLSTLADPSNDLTTSIIAAQNRALDGKIIIPAFFRDVSGGKDKDKILTFDTGHIIGKDEGGVDSGLNSVKIDSCIEKLEVAEVDLDTEELWCAISPRQHRILRNMAQVSQKEFEKLGGVIVKGRVTEYLGMNVMVSNKLTKVTIGGKVFVEVPVWVKSGVAVQPWLEPVVRVSERADKNYTTQLYCEARFGAIRTEEGRVLKVLCREDEAL